MFSNLKRLPILKCKPKFFLTKRYILQNNEIRLVTRSMIDDIEHAVVGIAKRILNLIFIAIIPFLKMGNKSL